MTVIFGAIAALVLAGGTAYGVVASVGDNHQRAVPGNGTSTSQVVLYGDK